MTMRGTAKLALALLLLLLTGCNSCGKPTLYSARPYPPKSLISERVEGVSPWKVKIYLTPEEPRSEQDTKFQFIVSENGQSVRGASVHVRLVMPLMDMGKNEFDAKEAMPGSYEGSGRFNMADEWEVFVTVTQGAKKATHVFNVRVVE